MVGATLLGPISASHSLVTLTSCAILLKSVTIRFRRTEIEVVVTHWQYSRVLLRGNFLMQSRIQLKVLSFIRP